MCDECAKAFVQSVPDQGQILIHRGLRDVVLCQLTTNCYTIEAIDEHATTLQKALSAGAPNQAVTLSVRTDLIPVPARFRGNSFRITGTAIEIELFEESLPKHNL